MKVTEQYTLEMTNVLESGETKKRVQMRSVSPLTILQGMHVYTQL